MNGLVFLIHFAMEVGTTNNGQYDLLQTSRQSTAQSVAAIPLLKKLKKKPFHRTRVHCWCETQATRQKVYRQSLGLCTPTFLTLSAWIWLLSWEPSLVVTEQLITCEDVCACIVSQCWELERGQGTGVLRTMAACWHK